MSDIDRAELRRLLDEAETPWTIEETTPNMKDCPTIEMTVCKGCYILGQLIDVYDYGRGGIEHVSYPCPTIQALDGGE